MFTPTHVAEILTPDGSRHVALRRTHSDGALEVYRDVTGREFLCWDSSGVLEWSRCMIRKLAPFEKVSSSWITAGLQEPRLSLVG